MENNNDSTATPAHGWKRFVGPVVRYVLPLALTVLLLVYMFKKVNFVEMWDLIKHGVDYWWILAAMGISIFSHVFRAARWRLQLDALGIRPPFMALCCSIFGCYALNLVFPRLGEVWRCTYVASSQKASFSSVLGSMIGDRLADTLMVLLLLLLCLVVAAPALEAFLVRYPVGRDIMGLLYNPWFWVCAVVLCIGAWVVLRIFRESVIVRKMKEMALKMWEGFSVVARMKGRWQFLFLTLCIWGCYYFQLYVAFYAFPFTRALCHGEGMAWGLTPCLVAFVLSSISMAIPSNGGLGPWNLAIMFGLSIYGVTDAEGTAFSMLQWSGQTVMLIILGIYTMVYISMSKKSAKGESKGGGFTL
ncbi:MAG: flippase-like domain-containing protein [Muribaculaceae bacterium]|nr:flippase-like domain-containing protein [Muribaculaceae bacterium]